VTWGRLADRQDQLHLLALVARGQGCEGMEDYRPPSEALREFLREPPAPEAAGAARRMTVEQFLAQAGGDT
jgi:hypothetical protein